MYICAIRFFFQIFLFLDMSAPNSELEFVACNLLVVLQDLQSLVLRAVLHF
jgi:hypothetical protein